MELTNTHTQLLSKAFEAILPSQIDGSVAFARFFPSDISESLAKSQDFRVSGWDIYRVGDRENLETKTIRADQAVGLRESKGAPSLFIVDTEQAGSGMDGIYSSSQEIEGGYLLDKATAFAYAQIEDEISADTSRYAREAIRKSSRPRHSSRISGWAKFDFLATIIHKQGSPGSFLHLLGLWPVKDVDGYRSENDLETSLRFVDALLVRTGLGYRKKIESLRLESLEEDQSSALGSFLQQAEAMTIGDALKLLSSQEDIWVNSLPIQSPTSHIRAVRLDAWMTSKGIPYKWSGLVLSEGSSGELVLLLPLPDSEPWHVKRPDRKLGVHWKTLPDHLEKDSVRYRVAIISDQDQELVSRDVSHKLKNPQTCTFTVDDFESLPDDAVVIARVRLTVLGQEGDTVAPLESENFIVRFGSDEQVTEGSTASSVRTFSDGLIEMSSREDVSDNLASPPNEVVGLQGGYRIRRVAPAWSFKIFEPALARQIDKMWVQKEGAIGRWRVEVRSSGEQVSDPEFIPLSCRDLMRQDWDTVTKAGKAVAKDFYDFGSVGLVYDDRSKEFESRVRPYLRAWARLLEKVGQEQDSALTLSNTLEVRSGGVTQGLIVLPSHPLRIAWHAAYDNLVLHTRFQENVPPKHILKELGILDGAMFPAFLPSIEGTGTFVFADMLGFHYPAMVLEDDREPKSSIAILGRALAGHQSNEIEPSESKQSARIIGDEIYKYIRFHEKENGGTISRTVHVNAIHAGDGFTVARSLGRVQKALNQKTLGVGDQDAEETDRDKAFVLELYPASDDRPEISGHFIDETVRKRRRNISSVAQNDRWMLESLDLPGDLTLPKLKWARKAKSDLETPAHVAVAFDTFESRVVAGKEDSKQHIPFHVYGMVNFFSRLYSSFPAPSWESRVSLGTTGEKHPSEKGHTDRLMGLQSAILKGVALRIGTVDRPPILQTRISPEAESELEQLHDASDWVITLDRNAGVEYFDSPKDDDEISDTYVIDSVPERDDMGSVQMITSTKNLDEVRNLLETTFISMGLSHSKKNAETILSYLKALSGRLAMRLTSAGTNKSELIALSESYRNCNEAFESSCWTPLSRGFLIPVDDVPDLFGGGVGSVDDEDPEDSPLGTGARPDLVYVTVGSRGGLILRFIEVKYRQDRITAQSEALKEQIRKQVENRRKLWNRWSSPDESNSIRAMRISRLARTLRFYADKASRQKNSLPEQQYRKIINEIDKMLEKGSGYIFADPGESDIGWIYCPEEINVEPRLVSPDIPGQTQIWLFGPSSQFVSPSVSDPHRPAENWNESPVLTGVSEDTDEGQVKNSTRDSNVSREGLEESNRIISGTLDSDEQGTATMPNINGGVDSNSPVSIELGYTSIAHDTITWDLRLDGNPHLLVAGLPGMGKTTALVNLCQQMLDSGVKPILFSYHEDIDAEIEKITSVPVRYIDFEGLGFNPLHVYNRGKPREYMDVASSMRDIFKAIYPDLGELQGGLIREAIRDSFHENGWNEPEVDRSQLQEPEFGRFVEILRDEQDNHRDSASKGLMTRLGELADFGLFDPGDAYESLWDSEQPIVIRVHSTSNEVLQKAFASLVFYGLYKEMFRRGVEQNSISHAIIFDEAHKASGLKLIPTMAKECRKYGISLVLASQEAKDFDKSLFSAIANYLVLRLNEVDAKALVRNVASSDREKQLVDSIKGMEKWKAMWFSEGTLPSQIALKNPSSDSA